MSSTDITKYSPEELASIPWSEIANRIIDTLESSEEPLPDKVLQAAEMLISNFPINEVASRLEVSTNTVRNWINRYPVIALALKEARPLVVAWRLAALEQQFHDAIGVSAEVLAAPLTEGSISAKMLGAKAQHARFLIGLFINNQKSSPLNLNINFSADGGNINLLNAGQDALDYIAGKIGTREQGSIDAEYRIIPEREHAPIVTEDGTPFFGEFGVVDENEDGILCHICGKRSSKPSIHVQTAHDLPPDVYEIEFNLPEGSI